MLANRVVTGLGPGGVVTVYNAAGSVNFALNVGGWTTTTTGVSGSLFSALPPTRICDTRTACATKGALGAGTILNLPVAGVGGIPTMSGGSAPTTALVNLTAVGPTAAGYLTIYAGPKSNPRPNLSDISFAAGQTVAEFADVQVGSDGTINIFNATGSTNVVVDVFGYTSQTKPDVSGLVDRGCQPETATNCPGSNFTDPNTMPSGWAGTVISAIVVNEVWSTLQPTSPSASNIIAAANPSNGTTTETCYEFDTQTVFTTYGDGNCLDQAIEAVDKWNSVPGHLPVHVKLRVFDGEYAPCWAQTSNNPNNTTIVGNPPNSGLQVASCPSNASGPTIGPFWTSTYEGYYSTLMSTLAGYYDHKYELENVVDTECMTNTGEPFIHPDYSLNPGESNLLAADSPDGKASDSTFIADDEACIGASVVTMASAWKMTHVALAFNPYQGLQVDVNGQPNNTETDTETFAGMTACASSLGTRCALENNSIRYPALTGLLNDYTDMYTQMEELNDPIMDGVTIDFQTASYANLKTGEDGLSETLDWACGATDISPATPPQPPSQNVQTTSSGQMASSVELPFGYTSLSDPPFDNFMNPSDYSTYIACITNDPDASS